MTHQRLGIDIGGTFTDLVLLDEDGRLITKKISSSVDDYATAIMRGLEQLAVDGKLVPERVSEVLHATTIASNTILEQKGARTGLITTKGFRDVLELRRLRMPRLYDLHWEKPAPLVDRYLRLEVDERMDERGNVLVPLKDNDVKAVIGQLVSEGIEVLAVCLLHSYINPEHERRIRKIAQESAPDLIVCISSDVLPEIKEYERTSTTVVNAYVLPAIREYCSHFRADLDRFGINGPLHIMQSNGGLISSDEAAKRPCNIIESGPAAGVIGARTLAKTMGLRKVISFDMGGTTAKAAIIEDGEVSRSPEYSVGAGIMIGSRLLTGGGYLVKVPSIDLAEVGAGGGSLIRIDPAGSLHVGPESAGADPGPACYGLGGSEPTLTDANMVLGYLNPEFLCGGEVRVEARRSIDVFEKQVASPLGQSTEDAAFGAVQIAVSNMIRAIKAVSSERGRDAREYTLFAFGGNGPLFAAMMARTLGMRQIVIPPSPGVFSSFGLLCSDVEHHFSRTLWGLLREIGPAAISREIGTLRKSAAQALNTQGFPADQTAIQCSASLRYSGQSFELRIPIPEGRFTTQTIRKLERAFGEEHERTYGHRAELDEPIEIVALQVIGTGLADRPRIPKRIRRDSERGAAALQRKAYFGPNAGWSEVPVLTRSHLEKRKSGPLIIEEYDATCVVPAGASAHLDDFGNVRIDLKQTGGTSAP